MLVHSRILLYSQWVKLHYSLMLSDPQVGQLEVLHAHWLHEGGLTASTEAVQVCHYVQPSSWEQSTVCWSVSIARPSAEIRKGILWTPICVVGGFLNLARPRLLPTVHPPIVPVLLIARAFMSSLTASWFPTAQFSGEPFLPQPTTLSLLHPACSAAQSLYLVFI